MAGRYKVLAKTGAKWMGMKDAGISFRPPSNGTLPPNYVADVIEQLAPTMDDLSKLGLINKSYVYGFDEMPEIYNQSVYDIFGGLKKKWPSLTTMAVLDWETFPSDLPLDIWVDEYAGPIYPYPMYPYPIYPDICWMNTQITA